MDHLSAAERHSHLYLVALAYEFPDTALLDIHVVNIGAGPHLYFLDLDYGLLLLGFLGLFALFIAEFAVVHDTAYRRAGICRHLNQVQPPVPGLVKSLFLGNHTKLLALFVYEPDLPGPDPLVNVDGAFFCDIAPPCFIFSCRLPAQCNTSFEINADNNP